MLKDEDSASPVTDGEDGINGQNENGQNDDPNAPVKKKQKRNKPTLSCSECVERKTKVSLDPFGRVLECSALLTPYSQV